MTLHVKPTYTTRKKTGPKPKPWSETRHGHPLYQAWQAMRRRCFNLNTRDYKYYGGRGITVCERWNDFLLFVQDMGPKPTPKHELDRKDNDGPYSPDNCKWSTRFEQLQNTRRNRKITFAQKHLTVSEWARQLSIPVKRICERLDRGWNIQRALTAPVKPGNRSFEAHQKAWIVRKENQTKAK